MDKLTKVEKKLMKKAFPKEPKKPKWIKFVNTKTNKSLAEITVKGIFPREITAIRKLLAQEQEVELKDIIGELRVRKSRK